MDMVVFIGSCVCLVLIPSRLLLRLTFLRDDFTVFRVSLWFCLIKFVFWVGCCSSWIFCWLFEVAGWLTISVELEISDDEDVDEDAADEDDDDDDDSVLDRFVTDEEVADDEEEIVIRVIISVIWLDEHGWLDASPDDGPVCSDKSSFVVVSSDDEDDDEDADFEEETAEEDELE